MTMLNRVCHQCLLLYQCESGRTVECPSCHSGYAFVRTDGDQSIHWVRSRKRPNIFTMVTPLFTLYLTRYRTDDQMLDGRWVLLGLDEQETLVPADRDDEAEVRRWVNRLIASELESMARQLRADR